jgi:transposase-like protein
MSSSTFLELTIGPQLQVTNQLHDLNIASIVIPLQCPRCLDKDTRVGTWGSYSTTNDEPIRYMCYTCKKTFNIAKAPYWKDKVSEIVWKLAQLTVADRTSVHSLAKKWNIPKTTLYLLIEQIKVILSQAFEQAKLLYLKQNPKQTQIKHSFRVFYYDEGFLRLLGIPAYLLFTLDRNGIPLTIHIERDRSAETIYTHLVSAVNQAGGIDVFIADGAPAILTALRSLRLKFLFVRHIHQGERKQAELILFDPIPGRKGINEVRLQLHTGALLPNTETLISVSKKKVYPKPFAGTKKVLADKTKRKKVTAKKAKPTTVFLPENNKKKSKKETNSTTRKRKGVTLVANTGPRLGQFELSYLDNTSLLPLKQNICLEEIHSMLFLAQQVLPDQFISSNRAEVFNAVHDHFLVYEGRKTRDHANRDLLAWVVIKFFPSQAKKIIQRHEWKLNRTLLEKLWPLIISKVKLR